MKQLLLNLLLKLANKYLSYDNELCEFVIDEEWRHYNETASRIKRQAVANFADKMIPAWIEAKRDVDEQVQSYIDLGYDARMARAMIYWKAMSYVQKKISSTSTSNESDKTD